MTRATLLHLLDHATAIGPAEVRELEQLAQAFPYCQTAHVLLAKAAHDQGTMLAGQRLRRAATYAADRELLRRLIERVPEAPEPEPQEPEAVAVAVPAPEPEAVPEPVAEPLPKPAVAAPPGPQAPVAALAIPEPVVAPEPVLAPNPLPAAPQPAAPIAAEVAPEPAAEAVAPEPPGPAPVPPAMVEDGPLLPVVEVGAPPADPAPVEADMPTKAIVEEAEVVEEAAVEEVTEVPAVAPPIRPPAELGAARFEFGLSEPAPAPAVPYVLPGLDEAAELPLSGLVPRVLRPAALPRPEPLFTPLAFTGDEAVGYGQALGSRYGFALEALPALMAAAEASWAVPPTPLPPTGSFFEPDALLTEYWTANRPAIEPVPSSLDLINNFLRRQPRLTRPAAPTPMTEAQVQADLSMRSTDPKPDLASESLARILARQGKNERAIEIYQRLMVKQPEKRAYYLAQIQSLQPPV